MCIIRKFLSRTAVFAVCIELFFYLVMQLAQASTPGIPFGQFGIILLCGAALAASSFVFLLRIRRIFAYLICYGVSLGECMLIFSIGGRFSGEGADFVFTAVILYTLAFAAVCLIRFAIIKLFGVIKRNLV